MRALRQARVTFVNLELRGSMVFKGSGCNWRFDNCVINGRGSVGVRVTSSENTHAEAAAPVQSTLSFTACRITDCRPQARPPALAPSAARSARR
eukprot:tig00001409_g8621.t1